MRHLGILSVLLAGLAALFAGCAEKEPVFEAGPAQILRVRPDSSAAALKDAGLPVNPVQPPLDRAPPLYVIKPDDVIQLRVWGEVDTSRTLKVGPDGRISYDLAGEIVAAGLTFPELRKVVTERLRDFYWEPRVIVNGVDYPGNNVTVLGAISAPGQYPVTGVTRLLDIMARAGLRPATSGEGAVGSLSAGQHGAGFGAGADLRNAIIVRGNERLPVDFYKLMTERDLSQNIILASGDIVWIPAQDTFKDKLYLIGECTPVIIRFVRRISFLEAITFAGDVDMLTARKWRVLIIRGRLSRNPEVIPVDYAAIRTGRERDFYMKAGDVIYVAPELGIKVERLTRRIVPFFDIITSVEGAYMGSKTAIDSHRSN